MSEITEPVIDTELTPTPSPAPDREVVSLPIDIPPAKKVKKPRKPMSAEHKAKLLAGLAKAREASAEKRGKKKEAKRILKEEKDNMADELIRKSEIIKEAREATSKSVVRDSRDDEIAELKSKLNNRTLQDVLPKSKPKKKKVVMKVIDEDDEFSEEDIEDMVIETKKKVKKASAGATLKSYNNNIEETPPKVVYTNLRGKKHRK